MINKIGVFRTSVFVPIIKDGYYSKDIIEERISALVLDEGRQIVKEENIKLASLIYFCNHSEFLTKEN